jgi:hypothetical protein
MQLRARRVGVAPVPNPDAGAADRTDRALTRLPEREWDVLAGFDPRHGVDHVAIGPGGVFAITSRMPNGVAAARVKDGMLWLRRSGDPRADKPGAAITRQVLESARTLHKGIRARTGRGPEVCPVVVLWCEFPQSVAESSRIAFVRGCDLLDWLSHKPLKLDAEGRAEIASAVHSMPADAQQASRARWRPLHRFDRRSAA